MLGQLVTQLSVWTSFKPLRNHWWSWWKPVVMSTKRWF